MACVASEGVVSKLGFRCDLPSSLSYLSGLAEPSSSLSETKLYCFNARATNLM